MTRPTRSHGYVLLLVLFALALAATSMTAICRMSLERAMEAQRAQEDLQRRWAVTTACASLLPKGQAVLQKADPPTAEVRREIRLGDQRFTLIFGDESAKANVNALYAQGGLAGAEREVRSLVQASGAILPVELRPLAVRKAPPDSPDDQADEPPAFEAFAQLFGPARPELLTARRGDAPSVVAGITCWGEGALNLTRASKEAVRATLARRLAAGEIARLLDVRSRNPKADASELLDHLSLSEDRRDAVEQLLTDDSNCHSLWIISATGHRNWYDLAVTQSEGEVSLFNW